MQHGSAALVTVRWLTKLACLSVPPLYLFLRATGSKDATPDTATTMPTSTTPPAMRLKRRFFNDGDTAASAVSGDAIIAMRPELTAAGSTICLRSALCAQTHLGQRLVRHFNLEKNPMQFTPTCQARFDQNVARVSYNHMCVGA